MEPEMHIVDELVGGLIALVGFGAGFLTRASVVKNSGAATPGTRKSAECGCGHTIGFHTDKTGECHGVIKRASVTDSDRCSCQRYDGPTPLPEYFIADIGN